MGTPRFWSVVFCAAILLGWGCAGSRRDAVSKAFSAAREEFDPETLNDDDFLLQASPSRSPAVPPDTRDRRKKPAAPSRQVDGYRVQIAAVLDVARAQAVQKEAEGQLGASVYVQYDQDTRLYKICAGNCRTPGEAERLRGQAKVKGYLEAFVVRSPVEAAVKPVRRPSTAEGHRVQIFLASGRQAADRAREQARDLLGRNDIYVEFEPPFFKVRVGNFRTREEADAFVAVAKKHGYDTPFSVKTQISAAPE